jgi:uncharacterized protein YndB with AHSA1/START domain
VGYVGCALVVERQLEPLVDESIAIAASAHDVWRAIVVADIRTGWWEYLDLDASVGGRFEERWSDGRGQEMLTSGVVTEVLVDRLLILSWADDDWPTTTRVEIRLAESAGTTLVRVLHSGWEALPDGAALAEEHRAGWRMHLSNLRRCIEGVGDD